MKATTLAAPASRAPPPFSRGDILGSAHKARSMSTSDLRPPTSSLLAASPMASTASATLAPAVSGSAIGDGAEENPLKRRSTEAVDYPRRRATIACEICRSRKSRCDGAKPKCKLCSDLGADCIYREPGVKLDAGDKLILERLSRIESLLQYAVASAPPALPYASSTPTTLGPDVLNLLGPASSSTSPTAWPPRPAALAGLTLLHQPLLRRLVAQPPAAHALLDAELAREPLPSPTKTPCVDLSNTAAYAAAFFARVNPWYACVSPYSWRALYRTALSTGFREGAESCIALLVLALGQASLAGSISRLAPDAPVPGMQYFTAAWALLPDMVTSTSVVAAQSHVLAAAYLAYAVRPMEAWHVLSVANAKLQVLVMAPGRVAADQRELVQRIYWNAVMRESEMLAELELPHSGLAAWEDAVSLPSGFDDGDSGAAAGTGGDGEPEAGDDLWYFLADIALRRIVNRVTQALYSHDAPPSLSSLDPVVAELDFQLSQWYDSLPLALQFPFGRQMLADATQTVLRLRFFACRTIIYRPYVLAVMENEGAGLDVVVRENCVKCLEAAVRQVEHVTEHHNGHLPYLWQGTLSIFSQTLLIMGATMSPLLSEILLSILPNADAIDLMINKVLVELQHYAALAPSLAVVSDLLQEAELRRRALLS
ncbi:hypothetical protein TD95_000670 [Thielaviopsis punctulata]|uniref:Zn(2)-C6 fungal-type domain-containing protein n=1 Tax=Thielaviopsis punctulata TaxID=72032 RepID=A0A0F4ZIF3_9PEZI|nr:hypothetical protein TD95_000670 [Thielaviopsis punctulata]